MMPKPTRARGVPVWIGGRPPPGGGAAAGPVRRRLDPVGDGAGHVRGGDHPDARTGRRTLLRVPREYAAALVMLTELTEHFQAAG